MKIIIKVMENGTFKWTHKLIWPQKEDNTYKEQVFEVDIKDSGCGFAFSEKVDNMLTCMTEHMESKETIRIIKNAFVPPNIEPFLDPPENVEKCTVSYKKKDMII